MIHLTRPQRESLKNVYLRGLLTARGDMLVTYDYQVDWPNLPICYREFRTHVHPLFSGGGCVLLPWQGMWLGIEPDGYTHS